MSNTLTTSLAIGRHNAPMKKDDAPQQPDLSTLSARLTYAMQHNSKYPNTNPNQIEVATGIKRQTLYFVQIGKTKSFSGPVVAQLCDHLGIRSDWLTKGDEPMNATPPLDEKELALIARFRKLSRAHQVDIQTIAERWSEDDDNNDPPTIEPPSPSRIPRH